MTNKPDKKQPLQVVYPFMLRKERPIRYLPIILVLLLAGFTLFLVNGYDVVSSFRSSLLVPFGHVGSEGKELSDFGKLALAVLMIAEWVAIWMAVQSLIDKVVTGRLDEVFFMKSAEIKAGNMKNHTIVCGGGRLGREVAKRLAENKLPYVILDKDHAVVLELQKEGLDAIEGDGTSEAALIKAGIKNAKTVVCAFGDDGDNIFLVLTAKELNPRVKVISRANHEEVVSKLRQAGSDEIVLPPVIGGKMIFDHIRGK